MFKYNKFWHFWFQLNNRNYLKAFLVSLIISLFLTPVASWFPPLWGLVFALPLIVGGTIALFTQLSNFFYNRQNRHLTQLEKKSTDETLIKQIKLFINRRVVCPEELFQETHLNLPHDTLNHKKPVSSTPLIFDTDEELETIFPKYDAPRRNDGFTAKGTSNQLYVKTVAAKDGLSEVAAREMAQIIGFEHLIPPNRIVGTDVLPTIRYWDTIPPNTGLVLSRKKINTVITKKFMGFEAKEKVQNAVAKFIFNLKTAYYRSKAEKDNELKLLHVQKLIPNAVDGIEFYTKLFNETGQNDAKKIVQQICLSSFQQNFLLHLILGSQDANPGNTLFTSSEKNKVELHSIDHERIMPEDNYNITKRIPLHYEVDEYVEKDIKNVFPIRIWLAGLPQADVPFKKELLENTLKSLNPNRLLSYHGQKKLFSSAAVGAQLERILLIKKVFEAEIKKSKINLTPKELFLKLINNHPTYIFLKNELQLSDLQSFNLLGQVPEAADMSFFRHPLQYFPILKMAIRVHINELRGKPLFSKRSLESPHAQHFLFANNCHSAKMIDNANKAGLDILTETSKKIIDETYDSEVRLKH